jgi:BirA family transcriptional regulator, biotin operon repressor / biotin---[acetyl-CoA-carboxylase] ligase
MNSKWIGCRAIKLAEINSTNSYMATLLAEKSIGEGTVVSAHSQTNGKGQRDSKWVSDPGKNILISILFAPTFLEIENQFMLSEAISLGVFDFVSSMMEDRGCVKIKWPNDVYIEDDKVAGILIENTIVSTKITYSIVGIGINLNQVAFPEEVRATSLRNHTYKEYDIEVCCEQLYSYLERRYNQLRYNRGEVEKDYINRLLFYREWKSFFYKDENTEAKIVGIDKQGRLLLEKRNAEILYCDIKEVRFVL